MSWLNRKISEGAYHLGGFIGTYPKYILVAFAVLSFALSTGIKHYVYVNDIEYLYTLTHGQSKQERAVIEEFFPFDSSSRFDVSRIARLSRFIRVMVKAKDEKSLLRGDIWKEIQDFDSAIRNTTIQWKYSEYSYNDLCSKWFDDCYLNEFLDIGDVVSDFEAGKGRISYPVIFDLKTYKAHALAHNFGAINKSDDGFSVLSAKYIMLNYFLANENTEYEEQRGQKWESAVLETLRKWDQSSKLKIGHFSMNSFKLEIDENVKSIFVPFFISVFLVMSYIIFSTTSNSDWVKSKPILGMIGGVSGFLGTIASVGILCYFQIPLSALAASIPFIMLAIGIDDTFVMLSVWRKTSPLDSVPKRMAECYSEAVVSVTITSITDMSSFYIGYFTPIPCIQLFSLYGGTGVLCIFIWQIFFFGSALAISGYYEAENKHTVFWCVKAIPRSKSEHLSFFKRFFFVGGINKADPYNPQDDYVDTTTIFFRDTFAPFLTKKWVQLCVVIGFVIYIIISCYGILHLEEGLELHRLIRDDSYMFDFMNLEQQYFREYPYRLQVVITSPMEYSLKSSQDKIKSVLDTFNEHPLVTYEFQENWLSSFVTYLDNYKEFENFNISNEADFIRVLRENYLQETSRISQDIAFNDDYTKIIASRYILQIINMPNFDVGKTALRDYRNIVNGMQADGINVTFYNPWFDFVDQFLVIRELAMKLLIFAIVIVMGVTIVLVPSFICCFCVLFTIFSIEIGVLGFMSFLGLNLDIISIISIVMCVGFSVDFSAHVSYAFISSAAESSEERLRDCLFSLGKPIIQGAMSTLIALCPLMTIPSYLYQLNCKIVFLIMIFATTHALVLLPVLLTILKPGRGFTIPWKTEIYYISDGKTKEICDADKSRFKFTKSFN